MRSAESEGLSDIVGARVLTGIQMVNISRLSTHPLPVVTGGFVTVAGQGPKDSNGAGKSSFIAGISLLSGDEQWRWSSGASAAQELLFTAEVAAQEGRHGNASHGYVIGVFTEAGAETEGALTASALTVWLRINRKAPYIDLRWSEGLHIASGTTEAERVADIDELWKQLPRRGNNTDIHASRLNEVLYGNHVRCVSFLSTSVRASNTPNLLAQPLNELAPERIFDAIAALTGLDRELEGERSHRSVEHQHRQDALQAEKDLVIWEHDAHAVEEGIQRRQQARSKLEAARAMWKGRCAQAVSEAHNKIADITEDLARLGRDRKDTEAKIEKLKEQLDDLTDDKTFGGYCADVKRAYEDARRLDRDLELQQQRLNERIVELTNQKARLSDQTRTADGRDVTQGEAELKEAKTVLETALMALGAAEREHQDATAALRRAESGDDLAADALAQLRSADVPAAALLDITSLRDAERRPWEARLVPYRESVVVAADDMPRAQTLLAGQPGTIIIGADPAPVRVDGLPEVADQRFTLTRFLSTLASRADKTSDATDRDAGVTVIGGFPQPITGRVSRIEQARHLLERASKRRTEAEQQRNDRRNALSLAERRLSGAKAVAEVALLTQQISGQREEQGRLEGRIDRHAKIYADAVTAHERMVGEQATRNQQIKALREEGGRHDKTLDDFREQSSKLQNERMGYDLEGRLRAFGERGPGDAENYLAALADEEQKLWDLDRWSDEAKSALGQVLSGCFPTGTQEREIPHQIQELWSAERWLSTSRHRLVESFPLLVNGVSTYLSVTEKEDAFQLRQLQQQRAERTAALASARQGLEEASHAASAGRASLATAIRASLKAVSAHFNDLDREYGGYGASLEFSEPEPPSEPDKPWKWAVTPKWSRAEGQRPSGYTLKGNTAQIEEKAIKLVCAAALTGGTNRPLLLILDELGRNLGKQHRHEAVALFESIGRDRNITVIGALQDDMERYAIDTSGLFVKLRRDSDSKAYNDPPAVVGHDDNTERVKLLGNWLTTGHIAAGRPGEEERPR